MSAEEASEFVKKLRGTFTNLAVRLQFGALVMPLYLHPLHAYCSVSQTLH